MNERELAEKFNRDLDRLLSGAPPSSAEESPPEYAETLDVAYRLSKINMSASSRQRVELEGRLLERAREQLPRQAKWKPVWGGALNTARSLAGAGLLVFLAVVLSWTIWKLLPDQSISPASLPSLEAIGQGIPSSPQPAIESTIPAGQTPVVTELALPVVVTPRTPATATAPSLDLAEAETSDSADPSGLDLQIEALTRYSTPEEIQERLAQSIYLWDTLWVNGLIFNTFSTRTTIQREQAWIDQPSRSLWLAGPAGTDPVTERIRSNGTTYLINLESKTRREIEDTRLLPSTLYKMIFPNWSFALRDGTYEVTNQELFRDQKIVAGRETVIVDYTNIEGQKVDRFWIDAITGVILRWVHLPINQSTAPGTDSSFEVKFTAINYDVEFPKNLFALGNPLPNQFSPDYQPELVGP